MKEITNSNYDTMLLWVHIMKFKIKELRWIINIIVKIIIM